MTPVDAATFESDFPSVRLIGTGDAFGTGGRLNTCFHVAASGRNILIDCGASSLIGLKRWELDPGLIDTVLVTHFHGDHYGGLPFLIRETQIAKERSRPLLIAGPVGLRSRLQSAMELMFPGSSSRTTFPLEILEVPSGVFHQFGDIRVLLLPVVHTPGTNPHGIRLEIDGRVIGYSGDTEWTSNLSRLADGADLFLAECYTMDPVPNHMDYRNLVKHRRELEAERLVVTHMGPAVLTHVSEIEMTAGDDGMAISL